MVMPLVGRYATSMEMAGVSFTLLKLDEELEGCFGALRLRLLEGRMIGRDALLAAIDRLATAMEREARRSMRSTASSATGISASP
jgi:hypothetical protein